MSFRVVFSISSIFRLKVALQNALYASWRQSWGCHTSRCALFSHGEQATLAGSERGNKTRTVGNILAWMVHNCTIYDQRWELHVVYHRLWVRGCRGSRKWRNLAPSYAHWSLTTYPKAPKSKRNLLIIDSFLTLIRADSLQGLTVPFTNRCRLYIIWCQLFWAQFRNVSQHHYGLSPLLWETDFVSVPQVIKNCQLRA